MPLDILGTDEPLLHEDESARELGRCTRTLRRWRALRDHPPCIRIGRQVYYRRSALRQWLLSREGRA